MDEQNMADVEEMPVAFNDLMFTAIDHGFDSIENNSGPLIPFVMSLWKNGKKEMVRFAHERVEVGVEKAKEYIETDGWKFEIYALAFDGFLTLRDG